MQRVASCGRCVDPITADLVAAGFQFCGVCEASYLPTRAAIALELAAYGLAPACPTKHFIDRTDGMLDQRRRPLPPGYMLELFGPVRRAPAVGGPFHYLQHYQGDALVTVLETWEARVWLPGTPHVYWRKWWRPSGEGEPTPVGLDREPMAARDRARFLLGVEVFVRLPVMPGGRPHRSAGLTDTEQAELAAYDELKANPAYAGLSDEHLARFHLKYSYAHLRYLLTRRRTLSSP